MHAFPTVSTPSECSSDEALQSRLGTEKPEAEREEPGSFHNRLDARRCGPK